LPRGARMSPPAKTAGVAPDHPAHARLPAFAPGPASAPPRDLAQCPKVAPAAPSAEPLFGGASLPERSARPPAACVRAPAQANLLWFPPPPASAKKRRPMSAAAPSAALARSRAAAAPLHALPAQP